MILVLPNMYYEEMFLTKKMLREGLNTVKQMIKEKKAELKDKNLSVQEDIISH